MALRTTIPEPLPLTWPQVLYQRQQAHFAEEYRQQQAAKRQAEAAARVADVARLQAEIARAERLEEYRTLF